MPIRRTLLTAPIAACLLVTAACSEDKAKTSEKLTTSCKPTGGERAAKAVLRCTESAVVFVETEVGSGTGVVIEADGERYVLTNEHVVDPFDAADATINGKSIKDVPVRGIDATADIALLGPLAAAGLPTPLAIADGRELERGDDVFLVGFPGESESDELEATISSGIVSRLRSVKEFSQSYIQTDASIGGGQSGGPLFDGDANLVGISGLSFAEEFALVLTGRDVKTAVERIVTGEGDEHLALPSKADSGKGSTSGSVKLYDANDAQVLFLPAGSESRTWNLTVNMAVDPIVLVQTFKDEEPLAVSSNAPTISSKVATELAATRGGRPEDLFDPGAAGKDPKLAKREIAPGKFSIPVKAEESATVLVVAPLTDSPMTVGWKSDLPLVPASRPVTERTMKVGESVDLTFGYFDTSVEVMVDLVEGQEVELHVRTPQGDPGFTIFPPGTTLDHLTLADTEGAGLETYDDTDDGLFGVDAKTKFKPEASGTHRFRVYSNDSNAVRVRFSVTDCSKTKCDAKKAEPETARE